MNYPRFKTGGFLRLLFGNFRLAFLVTQVFRDFAGSLLASAGLTILYRRNDLHRLRQCQPRSEVSYYFTCPILDVEGRIPIRVVGMAAFDAQKLALVFPVIRVNVPALRTFSRGILWIHKQDKLAQLFGFVFCEG